MLLEIDISKLILKGMLIGQIYSLEVLYYKKEMQNINAPTI